jgi:hypothetical protein
VALQRDPHREQQAAAAGKGSSGGWPVWLGGALLLAALLCAGGALELLPSTRREVWPMGRRGRWLAAIHHRAWA